MIKLKKINFTYYVFGLILLSPILFALLLGLMIYTFYLNNSAIDSSIIIDKYLEQTILKEIQSKKAEEIIDFKVTPTEINPAILKNPFTVIDLETPKTETPKTGPKN